MLCNSLLILLASLHDSLPILNKTSWKTVFTIHRSKFSIKAEAFYLTLQVGSRKITCREKKNLLLFLKLGNNQHFP